MKYLMLSLPMLLITACVPPKIEYLPLYLEQHPEKPPPPKLEKVDMGFIPDMSLFTLDAQELEDLRNNLTGLEKYIALLILNLEYYKEATTAPKESSAN